MPELHIKEIAAIVDGTLAAGEGNRVPLSDWRFSHYHFDTRRITEANTLFFALKTESGDGHRFLSQLEPGTGTGAVVSRDFAPGPGGLSIPLIRVDDPLKAAQKLAAHIRNTYRTIKYIGVTGSAGKTTTKEFIYQLLSHKYRAYRSFENWNNWIGLPFSILNMTGREEAAVFELAMSFPGIGEIDLLARILRPDAAVILNVYPVHLEFLKTVDNAAKAKSEILNYLAPDDAAFINGDCEPLMKIVGGPTAPRGRKIYFGFEGPGGPGSPGGGDKNPDIRLKKILRDNRQNTTTMVVNFYGMETRFVTAMINRTHVENLFVAIIVAHHLGMKHVEIQEAVRTIIPMSNRGQIRTVKKDSSDFIIIDETYNSNPEALKKTLDWVDREYRGKRKGKGEKIAVLGDMLELGEQEAQFHREVGYFFAPLGFDRLITVGKRAQHLGEGAAENGFDRGKIHSFADAEAAGRYLEQEAKNGSVILFKASRGIRLEKAVEAFLK